MPSKNGIIAKNLGVYGLTHGLVDATCIALIFASFGIYNLNIKEISMLIMLYNVLAFGTQPIFGFISDKLQSPKSTALIGVSFTIISLITFFISPKLTIILLGIGNAMFHVGGGVISLNLTPKRATAPGIYVAPGVIGLLIGGFYGKSAFFSVLPFFVLLIISFIFITIIKIPKINYTGENNKKINNYLELIIILSLMSIAIRALIGTAIIFPWKNNFVLLTILTFSIFFGKSLGGILADKFGWTRVGISSLLVSSVLLSIGKDNPLIGILGMFLFNMTMPITLVLISNTLPRNPGFSFGLTTLALIFGAIPAFLPLRNKLNNPFVIFMTISISAFLLYFALRTLNNSSCTK